MCIEFRCLEKIGDSLIILATIEKAETHLKIVFGTGDDPVRSAADNPGQSDTCNEYSPHLRRASLSNSGLCMKHHPRAVEDSSRTCSFFRLSVSCRDERLSHIPAATATPQMAAIIQIFILMTSPYHTGRPERKNDHLTGRASFHMRSGELSISDQLFQDCRQQPAHSWRDPDISVRPSGYPLW